MASETPTPPEGFESFEATGSDDDEDVPTVKLDGGEVLQGMVLDVEDGENENGPWFRLRVKDEARGVVETYAKGPVKTAARRGRIEIGEPIWIAADAEPETFETDDGEEKEYYPHNVAFPGGGD